MVVVVFFIPNTQLNISSHHWCTRLKTLLQLFPIFLAKHF